MLTTILKRLGYTIKACQDPEKALAEFTASPFSFDLIITDMTMPHINGVEFCAAIKKYAGTFRLLSAQDTATSQMPVFLRMPIYLQ